MAETASDRLRAALERLDQEIDRLDAHVAAKRDAPVGSDPAGAANADVVARLDRIIERIENALAD